MNCVQYAYAHDDNDGNRNKADEPYLKKTERIIKFRSRRVGKRLLIVTELAPGAGELSGDGDAVAFAALGHRRHDSVYKKPLFAQAASVLGTEPQNNRVTPAGQPGHDDRAAGVLELCECTRHISPPCRPRVGRAATTRRRHANVTLPSFPGAGSASKHRRLWATKLQLRTCVCTRVSRAPFCLWSESVHVRCAC